MLYGDIPKNTEAKRKWYVFMRMHFLSHVLSVCVLCVCVYIYIYMHAQIHAQTHAYIRIRIYYMKMAKFGNDTSKYHVIRVKQYLFASSMQVFVFHLCDVQ